MLVFVFFLYVYNKDRENVSFKIIFKILILNISVAVYKWQIHYLPYILPTLGLDCLVLNSGSATLRDLEEVTLISVSKFPHLYSGDKDNSYTSLDCYKNSNQYM